MKIHTISKIQTFIFKNHMANFILFIENQSTLFIKIIKVQFEPLTQQGMFVMRWLCSSIPHQYVYFLELLQDARC